MWYIYFRDDATNLIIKWLQKFKTPFKKCLTFKIDDFFFLLSSILCTAIFHTLKISIVIYILVFLNFVFALILPECFLILNLTQKYVHKYHAFSRIKDKKCNELATPPTKIWNKLQKFIQVNNVKSMFLIECINLLK